MAKKISSSEIAEDDVFGKIRHSAEETIVIIDKLSKSLVETAEAVKKSVGGAKFDSTKSIDNFVKATKQANDLQKQAIKLDQEKARATEMRSKAMSAQQKRMQETLKTEQQQKKVTQETIKIETEKQRLAQQRIRTAEQQAKADQRAATALEREKNALKNTAPAYKALSDRSRDLKNKSKELGAQMLKLEQEGKRNSAQWRVLSKQYQDVTAKARVTDQQLKKLDSTVGDNFRNVGNYKSAIGGLTSAMGQLGLAFGVGAVVRDTFGIVKDFDQGVANLASVLGKTRGEIVALEEDAKRLGAATRFTASEVAQLQTEFSKLGFNEQEILNATESTLALAGATGTELGRAAEVSGSTLRQFGLDAKEMGRVNDVMAKSFSTSALDMEKFAESMKYVGPIANKAGLSLEETTAMLGALANAGISGSNAGTALRQVISEMDKTGKTTAEALKDLATKGLSLADAEDEVGKNAKTALLVLTDQTKAVEDLTKEYQNADGAAEEMADTQLNTLGGSLDLLRSAWEGFILSLNDASGAGNMFSQTIKFIAENFTTIMSILGRVLAAWVAYKTLMISLNVIDKARAFSFAQFGKQLAAQIPMTKAYRLEQIKMARAARDSGAEVAKAGKAMGAVPWMAIIAVVIELAMALYDVASGAAEARRQQDLLNAANEAAEKNLAKAADRYRKDFDQKMKDLDLEIRTRKTNGEDEKKLAAEKLKREEEITQATIDRIQKEYNLKTKAMAETIRMEEILRDKIANLGNVQSKEQIAAGKEYFAWVKKTYGDAIDDASDYDAVLQLLVARESRLTTEAVGLNEQKKEYEGILQEVNVATKENDYEVKKTTHSAKEHKSAVKEVNTQLEQQIDLVKELNDINDDRLDIENEINQYLMDRKAQGLEQQFEDELALQLEYTKKTGNIDKIYLEELVDARAEILRNAAKEQAAFDIAELKRQHQMRMFQLRANLEEEYRLKLAQEGITPEQTAKLKAQYDQQNREINAMEIEYEQVLNDKILEINLKTQGDLDDIDIEAANKKKELNKELLDAQKEYNDQKVKDEEDVNKKVEDAYKKHIQDMKQIADLLTNYLVQQSEKRIAQMEKEIAAATDQRDYYQELAASGNITAKESLAEQNRIIAEANLKKEREERRKQKIELANTVFQTYSSKLESNSKSPLADTIRDISLLNQFVSSLVLPTFKEGTEDTGTHGQGVDGQGGFHAILHPRERVLTKEQNQMVGDLSNTELANLAASYQAGAIVHREGASQLGNGWNTAAIIKQLESLEQTIKNKPEHSLGVENVVLGAMDIVKQTKKGNTTILNRYKVSK